MNTQRACNRVVHLFVLSVLSVLSVLLARPLRAQRTNADAATLVRAMATTLQRTANLPGLSIAVSQNGRIVFAEGFGFADLASQRLVTPRTRFRTASVGKVITATALGTLVQAHRLDLDAPIQTYVPSFPTKAWPITARELAGHLAGMPHYSDADKIEPRFYPSVQDALTVFAHEALREAPNTRYRYSTHGITLLSAAIEGAARQPFLEYLQQAVLAPLGMRSTAPDIRAHPAPELATYYELRAGALQPVTHPEDPSYKWAGGGLTSTPSDLVRLAEGYFNGFLDAATVSSMWASQRVASGGETGVGLVWRLGHDATGRRTVEHAGSMEGARAVLVIFPDEHVVIALMTNREWSSTIEETAHMLALPFLRPNARRPALQGTYDLQVEATAVSGAKSTEPGVMTLSNRRGALALTAESSSRALRLFALDSGGVYALVRPDGIYHTVLRMVGDTLTGRSIGYGSPQLTQPDANTPFLRFSGVRRTRGPRR